MGARRLAVSQQNAEERLAALERAIQEHDVVGVMDNGGLSAAADAGFSTQEIVAAADTTFSWIRGTTFYIRHTFYTDSTQTTKVDLTGATVWHTAKLNLADADPGQFQKKTAAGITVVGVATDGVVRVKIDPADTEALTVDTTLIWDVKIKTAAGDIYVPDWGAHKINALNSVTRSTT